MAAVNRRDVEGLLDLCDMHDLGAAWESFEIEIREYRDLGHAVVAIGRLHAIGSPSGVAVQSQLVWLVTFRESSSPVLCLGIDFFTDPADALKAAGTGAA